MANFAERLRVLRKDNGLRQKDLARQLGVNQTTIANYEKDKRFPNQDILIAIAEYFEVSLDYLLGLSNIKTKNKEIIKKYHVEDKDLELLPEAEIYLRELIKGNTNVAFNIVLDSINNDKTIRDIYTKIFQPSLIKVGYFWETGQIDIAEEHFFTNTTIQLMSQLEPFFPTSKTKDQTVVILTINGDDHNIGVRMVRDFFKIDGWKTYYLGNNTPTASVIYAIEENNADLLAVSTTMTYNIKNVRNLINLVKNNNKSKNTKVLVGGQAFSQKDWKEINADGYAYSAEDAIKVANSLLEPQRVKTS